MQHNLISYCEGKCETYTYDRLSKVTEKSKKEDQCRSGSCKHINSPSSNNFSQDQADINNLNLVTPFTILQLRNRVCDHELLESAFLDDL